MARLVLTIALVFVGALVRGEERATSRLDNGDCGLRNNVANNGAGELVMNSRIVGGYESVPYSWPAICSFRQRMSPTHHMCGANLVKNRQGVYYMITAAHCVSSKSANSYEARCGIHGTSELDTVLRFSALTLHPNYNQYTLDNDIAILSLSSQPSSSRIGAVCLPDSSWFEGELGIVAGWGTTSSVLFHAWLTVTGHPLNDQGPYTSECGTSPSALRQVTKPIKSRSTCRSRYGYSAITSNMFCAGVPQGGIDSCQGDSGGPFYTYKNGKWVLQGLVSWGFGCAEAEQPGVYVDVYASSVYNFINQVIN